MREEHKEVRPYALHLKPNAHLSFEQKRARAQSLLSLIQAENLGLSVSYFKVSSRNPDFVSINCTQEVIERLHAIPCVQRTNVYTPPHYGPAPRL